MLGTPSGGGFTLSFWPLIATASHQLDIRGRCVLDLFTFLAPSRLAGRCQPPEIATERPLRSAAKVRRLYAWPIGGGRAAARPPAPKGALCIRQKRISFFTHLHIKLFTLLFIYAFLALWRSYTPFHLFVFTHFFISLNANRRPCYAYFFLSFIFTFLYANRTPFFLCAFTYFFIFTFTPFFMLVLC